MKQKFLKTKISLVAMASIMVVGCNDLETAPMGSYVTSDQKENVVAQNPEMISASVAGITAMFSQYGKVFRLHSCTMTSATHASCCSLTHVAQTSFLRI